MAKQRLVFALEIGSYWLLGDRLTKIKVNPQAEMTQARIYYKGKV